MHRTTPVQAICVNAPSLGTLKHLLAKSKTQHHHCVNVCSIDAMHQAPVSIDLSRNLVKNKVVNNVKIKRVSVVNDFDPPAVVAE